MAMTERVSIPSRGDELVGACAVAARRRESMDNVQDCGRMTRAARRTAEFTFHLVAA